MKQIMFVALAVTVLISSCVKRHSGNDYAIENGTYVGTFQRQVSGSGPISHVTITFNSGSWTGQSEYSKYPALCRGTYLITPGEISFENSCVWTADFDWTLILSFDYQLSVIGNNLRITRDHNGAYTDIYTLTKQ